MGKIHNVNLLNNYCPWDQRMLVEWVKTNLSQNCPLTLVDRSYYVSWWWLVEVVEVVVVVWWCVLPKLQQWSPLYWTDLPTSSVQIIM